MFAQPRQRPLVQEPGEIIRAVGQQLAAAQPDEEIEVLALDPVRVGAARRLRERRMREAERARVAAQVRQAAEQIRIRRTREQKRQQRVFVCARACRLRRSHRPCRAARRRDPAATARGSPRLRPRPQDALCGNMRPVGNRRLRNAYFARKRAYAAGGANRLV